MSTAATVTMLVAMLVIFGGLVASVTSAVRHARRARRDVPGRDT